MRILVTGGAGFIGSHISEAYIAEGHDVFIIDNLSSGKIENVPKEAEFQNMDIRSPNLTGYLRAKKIQVVNHNAANVSIKKSVREPVNCAKVNITGTLNLLYSCIKSISKNTLIKLIFASTSEVYGLQEAFPVSENCCTMPISPYGTSKLSCEDFLNTYRILSGIRYISLRYGNVFGPRQNNFCESGFVSSSIKGVLKNDNIFINGDGNQTFDMVFIQDVVHANVLAVGHGAGVVNIGTGMEISFNNLLDKIVRLFNTSWTGKVINISDAKYRTKKMVLNNKRAYHSIGWVPKITVDNGLKIYKKYLDGNKS